MVWCGPKNGHQKDMSLEDMGFPAQDMTNVADPIINIIGGTNMTI